MSRLGIPLLVQGTILKATHPPTLREGECRAPGRQSLTVSWNGRCPLRCGSPSGFWSVVLVSFPCEENDRNPHENCAVRRSPSRPAGQQCETRRGTIYTVEWVGGHQDMCNVRLLPFWLKATAILIFVQWFWDKVAGHFGGNLTSPWIPSPVVTGRMLGLHVAVAVVLSSGTYSSQEVSERMTKVSLALVLSAMMVVHQTQCVCPSIGSTAVADPATPSVFTVRFLCEEVLSQPSFQPVAYTTVSSQTARSSLSAAIRCRCAEGKTHELPDGETTLSASKLLDGEIFTAGATRVVYELLDNITIVGVKTLPSRGDVRQCGVVKRHEYGPRAVERMMDEDQVVTPVDTIIPTAGSKQVWFHQTFCCVAVRKPASISCCFRDARRDLKRERSFREIQGFDLRDECEAGREGVCGRYTHTSIQEVAG